MARRRARREEWVGRLLALGIVVCEAANKCVHLPGGIGLLRQLLSMRNVFLESEASLEHSAASSCGAAVLLCACCWGA